MAGGGLQQEVLEEQRDILAPLACKGGKGRWRPTAGSEVGAETPWFREFEQVSFGRGDDAAVDGDRRVRTEALEVRSCSTRSSLICIGTGMVSISSRNSVPPLACSILPMRRLPAPV